MRTQQGQWVKVFQRIRYSVQFALRNQSGTGVGSIVGSITSELYGFRCVYYTRVYVVYMDMDIDTGWCTDGGVDCGGWDEEIDIHPTKNPMGFPSGRNSSDSIKLLRTVVLETFH